MKPSSDCNILIQSFESCARKMADGRFKAYLPTPDDVPTIGWGSTGPDITLATIWTKAQCDAHFAADLAAFATKVATLLGKSTTTQHQFDAMVSLAYNIGTAAFGGSSVLKWHRAGDHPAAAAAFSLWVKQKGKVLAGLVRRRHAEAALYLG